MQSLPPLVKEVLMLHLLNLYGVIVFHQELQPLLVLSLERCYCQAAVLLMIHHLSEYEI